MLVLVDVGTVDVPITDVNRVLYRLRYLSRGSLKVDVEGSSLFSLSIATISSIRSSTYVPGAQSKHGNAVTILEDCIRYDIASHFAFGMISVESLQNTDCLL